MHQFYGVRRILAGMLCLLFPLCACHAAPSPEQQIEEIRSLYTSAEAFTATAEITADYGERVYVYQVEAEGGSSAGSMQVTAPESIAGTVLQWAEDDTSLICDGVTLETGTLTQSGLSPADMIPTIFSALSSGTLSECSTDQEGILTAELQHPNDAAVTLTCRFDGESRMLKQAELAENGRRVLTMVFSDFQLEIK